MTEAADSVSRALQLARERGDVVSLSTGQCQAVSLAHLSGEYAGMVAHGRVAAEAAERVGLTHEITAYTWLGLAAILDEDWCTVPD